MLETVFCKLVFDVAVAAMTAFKLKSPLAVAETLVFLRLVFPVTVADIVLYEVTQTS